jgi:glutaconate CoA-transferase subunit B
VFVVLKQSPRTFVPALDFCSSAGFLTGGGARARAGAPGAGPQVVITDFGVLKPEAGSDELQFVARYEHTTAEQAVKATGWPLNIAGRVDVLAPPDQEELQILRDLHERTPGAPRRFGSAWKGDPRPRTSGPSCRARRPAPFSRATPP